MTSPRDITPYRQPMITSLGIMMGFLLNFLAGWAINDDESVSVMTAGDWVVAGSLLGALGLMCFVLYRILDIRVEPEQAEARYLTAFRCYMAAVILAFAGLGSAILL
jgi:hypothetical protein